MIVIDISNIFILIFRRFMRAEPTVMALKSEVKNWSGFPMKALGQSQHTGNLKFTSSMFPAVRVRVIKSCTSFG